MSDDLWVRIVYDFALGHRLRAGTTFSDRLRPYLGWIASYALEMETAGPVQIDARIERLAGAYEAGKLYLVSPGVVALIAALLVSIFDRRVAQWGSARAEWSPARSPTALVT